MCPLGTLLDDIRTSDFITQKITVVVQMNLAPTVIQCYQQSVSTLDAIWSIRAALGVAHMLRADVMCV